MTESILIQNKALALHLQGKAIQVSHVTERFVRFRQIYENEFVPRRWSKACLYWDKKETHIFRFMGMGVSMWMNSSRLPIFVRNQKSNRPKEKNTMAGC